MHVQHSKDGKDGKAYHPGAMNDERPILGSLRCLGVDPYLNGIDKVVSLQHIQSNG